MSQTSQPILTAQGVSAEATANQNHWATVSVLLMLMLAVLDSSALQIALPHMLNSLDVTAASAIWILIAFQVALVALLLPFAAIADCIGYRRVFLAGGLVFVLASLLCALSHGMGQICAARALQGTSAAAIYSTNPSLVRLIFPGARLRQGIALSSITNALSLAAGPSIGAALFSLFGWQAIFLINVPIGLAGLLIGMRHLPSSQAQDLAPIRALDLPSLLLSAACVPLLVIGLDHMVVDTRSGVMVALVGAGAASALIMRQRWQAHQIIPLDLFAKREFALSIVCSMCGFLALSAAYTGLPFSLLYRTGAPINNVALYMMLPPLFTALGNWAVAPLSRWLSEIQLCSVGMLVMAGGAAGLACGPSAAAPLALLGLGFGLFQTPNNRMILGAAPRERSGNVSGTLAVTRTIGQTGGSSVVSICLAQLGASGAGFALCIAAVLALTAGGVGLARRPQRG